MPYVEATGESEALLFVLLSVIRTSNAVSGMTFTIWKGRGRQPR